MGEPFGGSISFVNSAAFSPGSRRVVAGSNHDVWTWDAETGKPVGKPFRGHTNLVLPVAFLSHGRHIVSGSSDRTIRI